MAGRLASGKWHSRAAGQHIAGLELHSGALATIGDHERAFDLDGRRYCHIIDPQTGWPVQHGQSVSVIAPLCGAAEALSTLAMLRTGELPAFLAAQNVPYLLVNAHGRLHHARI